jgi:deazaflavin-dependent oxidoreductase (nitroreductase family)
VPDINDLNQQIIDEFRTNGGHVGGMFDRSRLLLLHTTGARTGERRVNPLAYRRDGDRLVVFGSKGGAPRHPDWYHNLQANPRATVEVGSEQFDVDARVATDAERDRLWPLQKEEVPAFADYETKTDRVIPVVILEPVVQPAEPS